MNAIVENWVVILAGLKTTLALAGAVLACTAVVSLIFGVFVTLPNRFVTAVVLGYVELFRSVPLVVNVFFFFFGTPLLGLDLSPFAAATIGLSLWGGANGTVIVAGGLKAVPRHQWNTAMALGLRRWQIYRYVVGPQSLKSIIPAFTGLLTLLVQSTAIGALVGVGEFLKIGQNIIERATVMQGHSPAFEVYGAMLLVYFLICSSLSGFSRYLERRFQR